MKDIRISVVIPLYNGADHVTRALENLDIQDFGFPFEVIIVDDCSTDDSANIVCEYISKLKRADSFRLIRSPQNGRAGAARNIGVREARGHYILFNDQDDYPDTKLLRVLWENSDEGRVDLVSCAVSDRNGEPYYRPECSASEEIGEEKRRAFVRDYGYAFASLIKKSIITENNIFFPEKVMFEDCLYNVGIVACADTIQTIRDVLYYRENDQTSQTASFTAKKLNDRISAVLIYLESFKGNSKIMRYSQDIKLLAFYYVYLSCMLWLLAIPGLYTKELFDRCLREGRAIGASWDDVFRYEKRFSGKTLRMLKMIYDHPAMAYPARLCGTTAYKVLKKVRNRNR